MTEEEMKVNRVSDLFDELNMWIDSLARHYSIEVEISSMNINRMGVEIPIRKYTPRFRKWITRTGG